MTKAEERKILEQIVDLIQSTPMDSYIRSAFSGVPEYAVRNIDDDAAYNPVEERDMWEKRYHGLQLDCKGMTETLKAKDAEIEKLGTLLDGKVAECERLRDERDAMMDSADGLGEIIDEMEKETTMLKSELKQYIRGDIIAEHRTNELHRVLIERGIYGEFLVGTQEHITADSSCKWEYMQNGWRWHDLEYRKSEEDARKRFADYVRLECDD